MKKIVSLIIGIILIISLVFFYINIKNRTDTGLFGSMVESSSDNIKIENNNDISLLNLKVEGQTGQVDVSTKDGGLRGINFDEAIENGSFIKGNENTGKIKVEILNDSYDVIKRFYIKAGEVTSKWIIIDEAGEYYINCESDGFNGVYKVDVYVYKVI